MPMIHKQVKIERKRVEVKLDATVAAELEQYCHFLESDPHYVVGAILKLTFERDRDFRAWKEGKPPVKGNEKSAAGSAK